LRLRTSKTTTRDRPGNPSIHSLREYSGRTGVVGGRTTYGKVNGDGNGNGNGNGKVNGNYRCAAHAKPPITSLVINHIP
jgi:hypothetical protein